MILYDYVIKEIIRFSSINLNVYFFSSSNWKKNVNTFTDVYVHFVEGYTVYKPIV